MKLVYINNFFKRIFCSIYYKHYKNKLIFQNPKKYLDDDSSNKIKKPIFLLGVSSGGLTIISRIIRRNPNIISASGDNNFFYYLDELNQYYRKFVPKTLNVFRESPLFSQMYGINKYINKSIVKKKNYKSASKKYLRVLNGILKVYSKNLKYDRLIDKSQNNSLNVKFLDFTLRGCSPYYILIINNPYAVIAKNFFALGRENNNNLTLSIQHYKNVFNKCLFDLEKTSNKYLIINFDKFLNKPQKTMKNIFSFLDLKFEKKFMPNRNDLYRLNPIDYKWFPIRKNTHDKYVSKLSKKHLQTINYYCHKLIKKSGYRLIRNYYLK